MQLIHYSALIAYRKGGNSLTSMIAWCIFALLQVSFAVGSFQDTVVCSHHKNTGYLSHVAYCPRRSDFPRCRSVVQHNVDK